MAEEQIDFSGAEIRASRPFVARFTQDCAHCGLTIHGQDHHTIHESDWMVLLEPQTDAPIPMHEDCHIDRKDSQ